MSGYVLQLPEDGSVVLSGDAVRRLLSAGSGDAALLYMAVLQSRDGIDEEKLQRRLGWERGRFRAALAALEGLGLVSRPEGGIGAAGALFLCCRLVHILSFTEAFMFLPAAR